jgi:TetR/AcrR family transcriptional regulator, transcriptional repressor for nem operon
MTHRATRDEIIAEADRLFYQHGFEHTSFADIADAVKISRGNFYYHFKSKDEILGAVIEARLVKTQGMLDGWTAGSDDPKERIQGFVRILLRNKDKIKKYGCPVGTLCNELAKLKHDALDEAAALFTLFRDWLGNQFKQLGCGPKSDALAMHLLARTQGAATLANTFPDDAFLEEEVRLMDEWLEEQIVQAAGKRKRSSPNVRGSTQVRRKQG